MKKLALIAIACGIAGLALVGYAHAEVPDPLAAPGESLSLLGKLYKGGQIAALSIVAAFFALTIASRKIKWLGQGYRAVACASALGALALLAVPASEGTTPNLSMIVGAIVTAITLAIKPTKSEPTPTA